MHSNDERLNLAAPKLRAARAKVSLALQLLQDRADLADVRAELRAVITAIDEELQCTN